MLLLLACSPNGAQLAAGAGDELGTEPVQTTDSGEHDGADTNTDSGSDTDSDTSSDPPADTSPDDTQDTDEEGGDTGTVEIDPCGDGTCASDESCWSCDADCGSCDCPTDAEVVIYTQSSWNVLADAFLADPSPCGDYWISLPANSGDKTTPRTGGEPEGIRARGSHLHAMAEFHWTGWSSESGTWYDKGVEFRRRMESAGYDVTQGDTWAINELPSSVRSDSGARQDAIDAMQGLYDGPAGDSIQGTVFTVGMGHSTQNFATYKPYLEEWLSDSTFWGKANLYARFWAQEVYTDPDYACVGSATVSERSSYINDYVEHVAQLAEVGPSDANTAQTYLGRAYTPLMNAVWMSSGSGYGETDVSLEQMEHHVSTQVYAARSWSNSHSYPDGRLGFAWAKESGVWDTDLETLAARLASSIHYAYDAGGGSAAGACSPSGAYTWCACSVSGAEFDDGWQTFESW